MFAFEVHRSIVVTIPVSFLFEPGGKEHPERVLSETECHAFIHGAETVCIARVRYPTFVVLLLTLVPIGSPAKVQWKELNFERKEWRLISFRRKRQRHGGLMTFL